MSPKMQQLRDHANLAVSKGTGDLEGSEEAIPLLARHSKGHSKVGLMPWQKWLLCAFHHGHEWVMSSGSIMKWMKDRQSAEQHKISTTASKNLQPAHMHDEAIQICVAIKNINFSPKSCCV